MNRWQIVGLAQFAALCVALILPVTPPRLGGEKWAAAELFFADPSYLEQVAVNFVAVNLLMAIIALIFLIWARLGERRGGM